MSKRGTPDGGVTQPSKRAKQGEVHTELTSTGGTLGASAIRALATELRAELSATNGVGAHDGDSASFYARSEGAQRAGEAVEEHVKKAG